MGFVTWEEVRDSPPLLWQFYYEQTDLNVFVIESTDRERFKSSICSAQTRV